MFQIDVRRTVATAVRSTPMCPERLPQQHLLSRCTQNVSHGYIFRVDVPRTFRRSNMFQVCVPRALATATYSKTMCPEQSPQEHFPSRCAQSVSHSNIVHGNVPRTFATVTLFMPMYPDRAPQLHVQHQCVQNVRHNNMFYKYVPRTFATAICFKSMYSKR